MLLQILLVGTLAGWAYSCGSEPAPPDVTPVIGADPGHNAVLIPPSPEKSLVDITSWAGANVVLGGQGVSFMDVDGDGHDDIIGPALNATYVLRNRGDGSFYPYSVLAHDGVEAMFAYAVEVTGDGRDDLLLISAAGPRIWAGHHNGGFVPTGLLNEPIDAQLVWSVASFGDLNGNGRPDIYLGRLAYFEGEGEQTIDPGSDDCLTPGELEGVIVEGTPAGDQVFSVAGDHLDAWAPGPLDVGLFTQAAMVVDLDGDGHLDVVVGTEGRRQDKAFFGDGQGGFTERAAALKMTYPTSAMGYDAADLDGNGRLDLYITDDTATGGDTASTGDKLYMQNADGSFELSTEDRGLSVTGQYTGWGVGFVDLDNDSDVDLFVANGLPLLGCPGGEQANLLFLNDGTGHFTRVPDVAGSGLEALSNSRAAVFSDIDDDGDMDVLVSNIGEAPTLLRNDMAPAGNHWLKLRLKHPTLSPVVGARVTLKAGDKVLRRDVHGTPSYGGSSTNLVHFGLGVAALAEDLTVHWPNGTIQKVGAVKANQTITVTMEGQ